MRTLLAVIPGRPGPKGSVNAFCQRCARKHLPQRIVVKEESEVGAAFRKTMARFLKGHSVECLRDVAVETIGTVYVRRRRAVRNGVEAGEWIPSHRSARPITKDTGDVEKHVRNLHDALQDAAVLADDCLVTDLHFRKRWADQDHPEGIEIEIREALDD